MVGEIAIDFTKQRHDFATEAFEQFRGNRASHAVAAIHDDLHRAAEFDIADDLFDVSGQDIGAAALTLAMLEITGFDPCFQILNRLQRQRGAADHHLQAVVIRRVVAAGHRNARVAAQFVGSEVSDRGGNAANVNRVATSGADAIHQSAR